MINWQKANEIAYRERNREAPNFLSDLETDCFTAIAMLNELRPRTLESWRQLFDKIQESVDNSEEALLHGRDGINTSEVIDMKWMGFCEALRALGMVKE